MAKKKKSKIREMITLLAIGAVIFIAALSFSFVNKVKNSILSDTLGNISEITIQSAEKFALFLEADRVKVEAADCVMEIELRDGFSEEDIYMVLTHLYDKYKTSFTFILNDGKIYKLDKRTKKIWRRELEEIDFNKYGKRGVKGPVYNNITGRREISTYKKINIPKIGEALIMKSRDVETLYDEYELSFYNGMGYSYVIDIHGDILFRPRNINSSKDLSNFFDILYKENISQEADKVRKDLLEDKAGIRIMEYRGIERIISYVPVKNVEDWYVISVIPLSAVEKASNSIVVRALFLCLFIILVVGIGTWLYLVSRTKYEKEIEKIAYNDSLTGLMNFIKFKLEGNKILKDMPLGNYAVFYMDIRNFKMINDVFSYKIGDKIIQGIANELKNFFSRESLVARVNADNFVVLIEYLNKDILEDELNSIIKKMSSSSYVKDMEYHLDIYGGVCCREDSEKNDVNTILDRANMARKYAKERKNNKIVFYNKTMSEILIREQNMELKKEEALKNGEFIAFIQPKYSLKSGKAEGGEALVRWKANGGYISPGEFIPLFEKNDFIVSIDKYMHEEVCKLQRKWLDEGLKVFPISVNVSKRQLYNPYFAEEYIETKNRYELPDGLVELEFTESIFFEKYEVISGIVKKLTEHGYICSIDDFGSGYSSLNLLKDVSLGILKIDRLFFENLENNKRGDIIIRNVINMARELNMKIVAEGVETLEQLELLRSVNCDMVQGYIYDRPMPVEEFESKYYNIKG